MCISMHKHTHNKWSTVSVCCGCLTAQNEDAPWQHNNEAWQTTHRHGRWCCMLVWVKLGKRWKCFDMWSRQHTAQTHYRSREWNLIQTLFLMPGVKPAIMPILSFTHADEHWAWILSLSHFQAVVILWCCTHLLCTGLHTHTHLISSWNYWITHSSPIRGRHTHRQPLKQYIYHL